ncbi:MAG TPA: hypothetical protein VHH11_07885 [Gammaproteobacteria bacterium]|jgi:hypothetical protein|nr:hypothetical protein [Gammaproteobacteria bacterium]
MGIVDIVKQGLTIARTHRSLWLFAFVVGLGAGSGGGTGRGGGGAGQAAAGAPLAVVALLALAAIVAVIVIRFVSEGALIEGVSRARRNGSLALREGLRVGWAHWGVLFRIAALYVGATIASVALLAVPCVAASQLFGRAALVAVAVPTVAVAAPWLITLYMLQALASRIAVLENRHALDALRKARLFLHGRLLHALKLMAAAFLGTLLVVLVGIVVLAPLVLLLVGAAKLIGPALTLALGLLTLLPAAFVLVAFVGTVQSASWTLGYLEQTER